MKSEGWRLKSMNSIAMCAKLLDLHTNFSSRIIYKYTGCSETIIWIKKFQQYIFKYFESFE